MPYSKYSKKTAFYIIFLGSIIALLIIFNIYGFVLKAFRTNIVMNIQTDYKSRIESEEIININDIISSEDSRILDSYNYYIQPFITKYEYFNKLNSYLPPKSLGFPYMFQCIDFKESQITLNDVYLKNYITIINNHLKYNGMLYKTLNQNYESMGIWAVYLNDTLQYSSSIELNDKLNESIGSHVFYYNFSRTKQVLFRVVYKFKNKTTRHAEYLVIEKLLNINTEKNKTQQYDYLPLI